jgi:arabinogalactan endo-1,4-beta-galactosidase
MKRRAAKMNRDIKSDKFSLSVIVTFWFVVQLCICGFAQAMDYAIGADLSFLKQAEDGGTVFKDNGEEKPGLVIFKEHGYNWIRLRLFHTPTRLPNNLEYTIALAQEAK